LKTGAIIKYLPTGTSQEEINKLRKEFNYPDHKLILIVSGKENILDNLSDFIKSRKL
jgi:hypothetical protein